MKRDMLYFVRDTVRTWRTMSMVYSGPIYSSDGGGTMKSSFEWANVLVNDMQFFDCTEIFDYVWDTVDEMYPDSHVPPSLDAVLPADKVGLYFHDPLFETYNGEMMLFCVPCSAVSEDDPYYRRHYNVLSLARGYDGAAGIPNPVGKICVAGEDCVFEDLVDHWLNLPEDARESMMRCLRLTAGLLQTINQPRFVVAGKRDVSQIKRQSFKKATGKFVPDVWNMVSWNVDKPVKAQDYKEGTGGRLPLHYRRGYWRMAEEGWKNTRWSEERNRWEQYIHGYEAGNPAFGYKKNYHLPRKEHGDGR